MLQMRLDRRVVELSHEVCFPVVLKPRWDERVEGRVEHRVRHRPDVLGNHGRKLMQRSECLLALVDRARPACNGYAESVTVTLFGDEGQRRRDLKGRKTTPLFGRPGKKFAEEP